MNFEPISVFVPRIGDQNFGRHGTLKISLTCDFLLQAVDMIACELRKVSHTGSGTASIVEL